MIPAIFFGHGNPMNALEDNAYTRVWRKMGAGLPRPRAIVAVSAHWYLPGVRVTAMAQPRTIHDFGGFPPELYGVRYPAPGDAALAGRVAELLRPRPVSLDQGWGLDHGTWSVLCHVYPQADIPVVQLSVQPHLGPAHHLAVGRALASLKDEDLLVIGSGSATHNLEEFYYGAHAPDEPALRWVEAFTDWVHEKVTAGDLDELLRYRERAPYAVENHPTDEHLLPLFIALGAGDGAAGRRVHASTRGGVISMDTYAFG